MKIFDIGIKGIGSHTPHHVLTNEDIDALGVGTNSDWTKSKLGIEERRISRYDNTSTLGYHAAMSAINDARISKDDVDLIILATSSPDRISPSTACVMANLLNVTCPAFDINAVCSGFVYGLQLASSLISSGQYKNVLLVGAETYSNITDWNDRNCVFFGDGAGAVIVSEVENSWISTDIFSDSVGKEHFTCHHGEKFKMNGKAVYDFGTTTLPKAIKDSLKKLNMGTEDISWLVPHQPSIKILLRTAEVLNILVDQVVLNMDKFANTAGASIPMALDKIYRENKLKNDDILVLAAVGSGWTWGVSVIKYVR